MPDSNSLPQSQQTIPSTDRSLPIALLRARETVMGPVRDMLSQSRISEQKWRVLRVVDESGPMDQTLIAQRACLLLPSLTRIIRSMETDGLLTRVADQRDKRKSMVSITRAGRQLIAKHTDESRAIFSKLEEKFGKDDLAVLMRLLDKLQKTEV